FAKRNIYTIGDLLHAFPRNYENRGDIRLLSDCRDGETHAVLVTCVDKPSEGKTYSGIPYVRMLARDGSASLTVTFFGKPFLASVIRKGAKYRLYGKFTVGLYGAESNTPEIEPAGGRSPLPDILPVYPMTAGMTQNLMRKTVEQCLHLCARIRETLPEEIRQTYGLMGKKEYVRQLHCPDSMEALERAKRSAAFEDLLVFQLALRSMRAEKETQPAPVFRADYAPLSDALPFTLTGAQKRVIEDVFSDFGKGVPMARLVQGDVGSGKTVIAAAALECCARNGMQGVLLAPTELLAEQHFATLRRWLEPRGVKIALLTASIRESEKKEIRKRLNAGEIDLLIGTHAVLQESVAFRSIGLVVTDEQHRFGVRQRAALLERSERNEQGLRAHMLVLSATPIPRSLSLILYGDLDVSVLDELPPGRQPVQTMVLLPEDRERIYKSIRRQLTAGGQAYIICPLVEDGEDGSRMSAESCYEDLRTRVFPDIPMGLVHGKLSGAEKAEAMKAFSEGKTRILVATSVIEVGVDVPNANVMLIENAECFGLSQLHQLRGRIGRGSRKSFCVLLNGSGKENSRLDIMCKTADGFKIAEADLAQRGPGDFFGVAQSGEMPLGTADFADMRLVAETREALDAILPRMGEEAFEPLRLAVSARTRSAGNGRTVN
ncbi:MAG: ATP-dependent DNA helicase RecG, partial [Clostridia bacterium]|nr:ATP-dependent DNA helicase RecG [Clostridia bacterium]